MAGAGDAADLFLRALSAQRVPGFRVLGILAPRARQAGRRILGVPILGAYRQSAPASAYARSRRIVSSMSGRPTTNPSDRPVRTIPVPLSSIA